MATSADASLGKLADRIADLAEGGALVSDLARQQLATIRDEWLAPLIARMGELERENGRLEAERDEQRRRAEVAETMLATEQERVVQAAQDAPGTPILGVAATPPSEIPAGLWQRLRSWWGAYK